MEQHKVNDLAQDVLLRCFFGMHVSCGINIKNMTVCSEFQLDHQLDVWHVGKGINRKLAAKARGKGCEDLLPWIQSVSNHLWWCCATSNGDAQLLK